MRRVIAIFLLLILPLQVAFAAAAEYCEVGKADSGQHFGHHAHKADASDGDSSSPKGAAGFDCEFCHLGCAQAQASSFVFQFAETHAPPGLVDAPLPRVIFPPVLDRPPRFALA